MDTSDAVAYLDDRESWEHLASQELGRIVTHVGTVIDVFPVNYVLDDHTIVFRTAQGSKLFELTVNDEVLFEVDSYTDDAAWSVIVRGTAAPIDTSDGVAAADELPLRPWIPTLKYTYVRVTPRAVSGRAFVRTPEPDRYGVESS